MRSIYLSSAAIITFFLFSIASPAQPLLTYSSRITGLSSPIDIVNAKDGSNRIFIVQQGGTIRVYNQALTVGSDFLTVTGITAGGERGLLSMAFHPNYAANGFFFVYYTNGSGDLELARYHVSGSPNVADPASKVVVLTIPHPTNSNHNGGKLNFGTDGFLYFATGDGGGAGDVPNNAQNGAVLLGKMLRIDVNTSATAPFYTIPPTNPFTTVATDPTSTIRDEIWAFGLRNPFRWSFDRANGDMWIGDVGQGAWEEVDYIPSPLTGGLNFGWRCYEGNNPFNTAGCLPQASYYPAIFQYDHGASGGQAIIGGFVYRGPDFPSLQGYFIAADEVSGNQWKILKTGPATFNVIPQAAAGLPANISSFGEAENGTLYAVNLGGSLFRVDVSVVLPARLIEFTGQLVNDMVMLRWKTASEQNLAQFEVEYSANGINYQRVGIVPATNSPSGSSYQFQHQPVGVSKGFYRLRLVDVDARQEFSAVVAVSTDRKSGNFVYPSVVTNGIMTVYVTEPFNSLEVINSNGALITRRNLNGQTGKMEIAVSMIPAGAYLVQLKSKDRIVTQRVIVSK